MNKKEEHITVRIGIGGSPCTLWSVAQKKNRETEPQGLGWELFKNYLIALVKYKPDYFLYENNKSMAPAIRNQITQELGVEPIAINSSLVSAQNRNRLYWTNIPNVVLPEDKGIVLRDILESGIADREKAYCLKHQQGNARDYFKKHHTQIAFEPVGVGFRNRREQDGKLYRRFETHNEPKSNALTTVQTDSMVAEPIRIGTIENAAKNAAFDSQQYRVYSPEGKSVTLCGNGGGVGARTGLYAVPIDADSPRTPIYEVRNGKINIKGKLYPIKLPDGFYIIRKLSVLECKRLQTVPDNFIFPVSDTQAYKMLGNGWTVDVIAHIMSFCNPLLTDEVEVLSMYDGMSCGRLALNKLGANVVRYYATEIDKYAIHTTQTNFPDTIQLGDAFGVREPDWHLERR